MTASATTEAQAELISSLSQDEIPIKLRCAICSRLAVNAFRLPCCEQAICESCQSTLPSSCPVCEHTPVAAEDCKPNKSLRTTIKVFLRTEEKKREALRLKEVKISPPPTPLDATATPVEAPAVTEANAVVDKVADAVETDAETTPAVVEETPVNGTETSDNAEQDVPQPSIEEIAPGQEPTEESVEAGADETEDTAADGANPEKDANGEPVSGQAISQAPVNPGFGFNPSAAGGFPMGFGGDFNQMQMMMAMQNGGMGQNAFGNFPMMAMPGMGMDPMTMQNMFMNGGFGMNGMNMSMGAGMGGFDGGVGAGFNNEWNGQQSWNVGPDNFNHPNAASMGTGDYGSNNSGYNPHASRYNQGNYGHGGQYNDYSSYGQQSRNRGRGGYGANGSNEAFSQQMPQQFGSREGVNGHSRETGQTPTGPKADGAQDTASNVDEFGREIRPASEVSDKASAEATAKDGAEGKGQGGTGVDQDNSAEADHTPRPIQTLDEAEGFGANGFPGYNPGLSRGAFGQGFPGSGGFNSMPPAKPNVPINAPTGPKAMRDGLPNTGLSGLRVRGFAAVGVPLSKASGSPSVPPEPEQVEKNSKGSQRSKSPSRDRSRERSRDRRRSRSRDRHHRRHRTPTSEDEKDSERRRERRRERHRRREDGNDREDTSVGDKHDEGRDGDERSRPASPSDSKRSGHKSRHDKDKYRERDRDSDREYKSSSSHKHRSGNRHRDDRSRSRDRDREHRHRHSRRDSEAVEDKPEKTDRSIPPTPVEPEDPSGRPSTASNGTIEIKGGGNRRQPPLDDIVIPTGPRQDRLPSARERDRDSRGAENRRHRDDEDSRHRQSRHRDSDRERERERAREKDQSRAPPTAPAVQDPHTMEREARNRERLLKEAQRIAGMGGMAGGGKRNREDGDDGRKGRRKSRRGEEGEEARLARLEAERESSRWN